MSDKTTKSNQSVLNYKGRHRSRWVVVLLALLVMAGTAVLGLVVVASGLWSRGFTPQAIAAAAPVFTDVVGDLGGMPVRIPRHIPELLEYDGDPGWAPRPGWRPPERTHASRIASFGFELRYPDMQTLSTPELQADFRQRRMYQHNWMSISVQSGARYSGHGFLDRQYRAALTNPEQRPLSPRYEEVPTTVSGLRLYAKQGINPHTGRLRRYESFDGDVFIRQDAKGFVTTHIRCLYRSGTEQYFSCEQSWSMESHQLSIEMWARYTPDLLPHWQDIQTRTSKFVLGFKDPTATPPERSPR